MAGSLVVSVSRTRPFLERSCRSVFLERSCRSVFLKRSCRSVSTAPPNTTALTEDVRYPAIKGRYPPGSWGSMPPDYAWQWQALRDRMLEVTCVEERQKLLLNKKTLAMIETPRREHRVHDFDERVQALVDEAATVLNLQQYNQHPSVLQATQFLTKTHLLKWAEAKPKIFDNLDTVDVNEEVKKLKKHLEDHFLIEHNLIERTGGQRTNYLCKSFIRCLSENLITELGPKSNPLQTCQYDEDVLVRAMWSRHGLERQKRQFTYDTDNPKYTKVQDQLIVCELVFDAMVRSHLPLPLFEHDVARYCVNDMEKLTISFKPTIFGQSKPSRNLLKSLSAGYRYGDPCQFGLIGFLSTCSSHQTEINYGPRVALDSRIAMGLTSSFSWLVAQACNQGINYLTELSYPLTCQTVLTDGKKLSLMACQLNTLELWKDDDANRLVNLCWNTPEMSLFHSIEDGHVKELNEDVLSLLVKMFSVRPSVSDIELHLQVNFIPEKQVVEQVIKEEEYIVY